MKIITKNDAPTLQALCDLLIASRYDDDGEIIHDTIDGIEIDTTSLPSFGGDEPTDTVGIYSWDTTRFLVPDNGEHGWKLVQR